MTSAAAISPSAAYTNSDRTNAAEPAGSWSRRKSRSLGTGLKYDANDIYLAAMYRKTQT
jgi:outer membrane pore protein E